MGSTSAFIKKKPAPFINDQQKHELAEIADKLAAINAALLDNRYPVPYSEEDKFLNPWRYKA